MRSAFTLVELSIIVAIIAILAAGVTAGTRLIEATKLNNVAVEILNIDNAVETFELAYKGLPGDLSNAASYFGATNCAAHGSQAQLTCNGNGNDEIGSTNGTEGQGEHAYAFHHMQLAAIYKGTYNPDSNAASEYYAVSDLNSPYADIGGIKGYFAFWGTDSLGDMKYQLLFGSNTESGDDKNKPFSAILSANMLLKIDTKIDNANITTGRVVKSDTSNGTCTSGEDETLCRLIYYSKE